jgi:hypothetical protein
MPNTGPSEVLADVPQALRQADGGRRLPLARLRRRHARDAHDLPVRLARHPVDHVQRDLRLVAPVRLVLVGRQAHPLGDGLDREELRLLRDLKA